jgi:hypothetical protein
MHHHNRIYHKFRRYIKIPFDSFSQTSNEFEIRLRKYIHQELGTRKLRLLQFVVFVAIALMFRNIYLFESEMIYLFLIIIIFLFALIIFINTFKHKQKAQAVKLFQAINFIKEQNYSRALDLLLDVYEKNKSEILWSIIDDFVKKYPPTDEQQARISLLQMPKKKKNIKDTKLKEILEQLGNVTEYIKKHTEVINKIRKKISDLNLKIQSTLDARIKSEYESLIKRYTDIIELEKSKIKFYEKARNELLKLKENHLFTQNLIKEKAELENLENNLLEKSITEAYNSDMSIDDFINYEKSYLDAIKEYSETVSVSSDKNIFEEIIRKFDNKTEFINRKI